MKTVKHALILSVVVILTALFQPAAYSAKGYIDSPYVKYYGPKKESSFFEKAAGWIMNLGKDDPISAMKKSSGNARRSIKKGRVRRYK